MLTITDAAKQQIVSIMEGQGRQGDGLRLGIIGRSSSGFRYTMGLIEAGQEEVEDVVVDSGAFKVFVDPQSRANLEGATIDYIDQGLQGSGFKIDNPNPIWSDPTSLQIQDLLDSQVNPNLASHGGHVEMLEFKDGVVYVQLGGGCQGCGMVDVTLRQGIEAMLQEAIPEITGVIDTTDHAAGTNPYYQPAKG
ncbi:Fe/S biogenesis protein NfuA [Candidatus Entotheonellaceae bacterium PAL068K]